MTTVTNEATFTVTNIGRVLEILTKEKLLAAELCAKVRDRFPGNTPGFIDPRLSDEIVSAGGDYDTRKSILQSVIKAQDREILDLVLNRREAILNAPEIQCSEITKPEMINYYVSAYRKTGNSSPVLFKSTDGVHPSVTLAMAKQDADRISRKGETPIRITKELIEEIARDLAAKDELTDVRDLPLRGFERGNK